jgi:hypothetical protein
MRLKFWRWAHRRAEALWHWIYRNKLGPEENKLLISGTAKRPNPGSDPYGASFRRIGAKQSEDEK